MLNASLGVYIKSVFWVWSSRTWGEFDGRCTTSLRFMTVDGYLSRAQFFELELEDI